MDSDFIKIRGARVHNLKNIDLDIPKNKLVVITGISGSGKSSLAFDTLYAEGQRRYVESLSAYARQFLGVMKRPDVDKIEGLSPAIAIDQKHISQNPRSTVGTVTEIYDYLRLLFARIGKPHCPQCQLAIQSQSVSEITDILMKMPPKKVFMILAPLVRGKKGEHRKILEEVARAGFVRGRIDNVIMRLKEALLQNLDPQKKHSLEVVVDRIILPNNQTALKEERSRVADSVETALKIGNHLLNVVICKDEDCENSSQEILYSSRFSCPKCNFSLSEIEPRTFSFNSPYGACPECHGLGEKLEFDPSLIIPNPILSVAEGAIKPWATASHRVGRQGYYWYLLSEVSDRYNFNLQEPFKNLSKDIQRIILYGDNDFEGVIPNLKRRYQETASEYTRSEIEKYTLIQICPLCQGKRLKKEALAIKIQEKNIVDITSLFIKKINTFLTGLLKNRTFSSNQKIIAEPILREIMCRLNFLNEVGLDYLTLDRKSSTLAGGEAQRIRLATQIGSGLSGVLYILDEPSIGLHQRDQTKLIKILKELRDLGNTVIVVEHDRQTIEKADWVIDIGPGAGKEGGKITAQGAPQDVKKTQTATGFFLSGKDKILKPKKRKKEIKEYLEAIGCREHNLKNIDVKIPLGKLVAVTGVSGSGKSTLVNDILARALFKEFYRSHYPVGAHKYIKGKEYLDKVVIVDQSPIGRTPRSNPITYTNAFGAIRELFAETREAKIRGYQAGRFSFNVKGGRCEVCEGQGLIKIEMQFLADVYVECEICEGKRYAKEVLEVEYKGKNIADALKMTVKEASDLFKNIPQIQRKLALLSEVGLDYLTLGQSAPTLSGGEAQRIKLAKELSKVSTRRTLYILDEPTTGLHFSDVKKLIRVLDKLVEKGNTILIIEHNLDVIRHADWIIDLGPEGGENGGYIVAQGSIETIKKAQQSWTGKYL